MNPIVTGIVQPIVKGVVSGAGGLSSGGIDWLDADGTTYSTTAAFLDADGTSYTTTAQFLDADGTAY